MLHESIELSDLPAELITRELARWLKPAERQIFRISSRGLAAMMPFAPSNLLEYGAKRGNPEICDMGISRGDSTFDACRYAASRGHVCVLEWAKKNRFPWDSGASWAAARHGRLEVLVWLLENARSWIARSENNTGLSGESTTLRRVKKHKCPWDRWTVCNSTRCGSSEGAKWFRYSGHESSNGICLAAATGGHMHVLEWARSHGYGWDYDVCTAAAAGGYLDILKWSIIRGCGWIPEMAYVVAAKGGHLEVLKYIWGLGYRWGHQDYRDAYRAAAKKGHVHVLRWAKDTGYRWDSDEDLSSYPPAAKEFILEDIAQKRKIDALNRD